MRRKILFLFLIFLFLMTSCYVSKAFSSVNIEYDGQIFTFADVDENNFNVCGYLSNNNGRFLIFYSFTEKPTFSKSEGYLKTKGGYVTINYYYSTNEYKRFVTKPTAGEHLITFYSIWNDLIYSNFDIVDKDGDVFFEATDKANDFKLDLDIDKTDYTVNLPITVSCQLLSTEEIKKYKLYYSIGNTNDFKSCDVRSFSENGVTMHQWCLEVYRNDTYHFKFINEETGEEIYESIKISNIVVTQDNVNNYIDGVFRPSPYLSYEYISDTEINILTQKFTLEEISKLKCFYAKDIIEFDNEDLWSKLDLKSYRDTLKNKTLYQFYLNVKNDNGSGDGTYHFRFFNKETEEYTYSTFKLNFSDIVEYHRQDEQNETSKSILDIMKDFFSWIFNFFGSLLDFFVHIFVPTDEQWADLDIQDLAFKGQIEGKFPFFYWFQEELEKADEYVYSDDFLKIDFPSWKMDLGIIKYQTPDISFTSVRDAYAPYRLTIRNSLFIIAVGLAIVYVIKYVLNYSITGSDIKHISNGGGKE